MKKSSSLTSPFAQDTATFHTQPPLKRRRTGLLTSSLPSNPLLQRLTLGPSNPITLERVIQQPHLKTSASTSLLRVGDGYMELEPSLSDTLLPQTSSFG